MSDAAAPEENVLQKDWLDRISDLMNPILVKEIRQSLKSRGFISVFMLMLIASWLISAVGVLYTYGPELTYSAAGRSFFHSFYVVLAIAVFVVVPQAAFRSIQSERELQTYDMLTITTLSPRKIIWGKWWSATIQAMVFYAAIAPFMVFTTLLRGISLPFIIFTLIWSFIGSACLAMLALGFSTFTRQRQAFGLLQFLLVMPLISGLMTLFNLMFDPGTAELPFDEPYFWMAQVVILSLLIPSFVLVRQIATANLTFEGANRSTGIRVSCLILTVTGLGWLVFSALPRVTSAGWIGWIGSTTTGSSIGLAVLTSLIGLWVWLIGLFTTTEDDRFSRRVRQEVPKSALMRLVWLPFYPGGGRGFLYFLIQVGLLASVASWLIINSSGSGDQIQNGLLVTMSVACYLLFYIGITSFLGRRLRRLGSELHATHGRVLGVLIVAAGTIGPLLFVFWEPFNRPLGWFMLTNPFWVCSSLLYDRLDAGQIFGVMALGCLGLLLNIPNMLAGIREMVTAPRPAVSTSPPSD